MNARYKVVYIEQRSEESSVQVTDSYQSLSDAAFAWDTLYRESVSQSWPKIRLLTPRPTDKEQDMRILQKLFGKTGSVAIAHQAIDFLSDPIRAAVFCRARSVDAALIASSLTWRSVQAGIATTGCMGVTIHRVYGGYGDATSPFWGMVEIGHRKFSLETEEQAIAYLIARQDVRNRAEHEVPALLRTKESD